MKKLTAIIFLSLFSALLLGCGSRQAPDIEPTVTAEPDPDATATPVPETGTVILTEGKIVAAQPVAALSFNISGRLSEVLVQPGDVVAVGDVLARLDTAALEQQLAEAQLGLRTSEIRLAQAEQSLTDSLAQAQIDLDKLTLQGEQGSAASGNGQLVQSSVNVTRAQEALANAQEEVLKAKDRPWEPVEVLEFYEKSVVQAEDNLRIARAGYADAANAYNSSTGSAEFKASTLELDFTLAHSRITQLERGVDPLLALDIEKAQLTIQNLQQQIDSAELIAPIAGEILVSTSSPVIGTNIGTGSPILQMLPHSGLYFQSTNLSERDFAQITVGQTVEILLKSYPNELITGHVLRILPEADGVIGDAATFPVLIELDVETLDIRPGMTGRAEIINPLK